MILEIIFFKNLVLVLELIVFEHFGDNIFILKFFYFYFPRVNVAKMVILSVF